MKRLTLTYVSLLALLALTLLVYRFPLAPLQTPMALAIAALKIALIAWFFMQLRLGHRLERLVASAGLLWIISFYLLSSLDLFFRPNK